MRKIRAQYISTTPTNEFKKKVLLLQKQTDCIYKENISDFLFLGS